MDDLNALERQIGSQLNGFVGPVRPVDDVAIFTAIVATQSPTWRFGSVFSATKFVVAGAIVALFGGFVLVAQPFDQQEASVPRAATTAEGATPVEFTATIKYGTSTVPQGVGFQVVASDARFEGALIRRSTRAIYPGVDIEVETVSKRIENEGGAWQEPVGVQLADLPGDESPSPGGRRELEPFPVTYVGVDGYEGLFIVAEATWDVVTLETDIHGYIFEGEPPVTLVPWAGDPPRDG